MHFLDALIETFKQVFTESGHDILDVVGMVPLLGELADGINGVWYLAEGDEANAALSFIALAPLVGSSATGGRLILKIKNGTKTISKTVKANSRFIGKVICPLGGRSNQGCSVVSMTKIIEEVLKNDFFDDEYPMLLKELFDNNKLFEAFIENPRLVNAWKAISGKPSFRKNKEMLDDVLEILNSPNNGIYVDIMAKIVEAQKSFKGSNPDFPELILNIKAAERFTGSTGFSKVVTDLQKTNGGFHIGANWTLEYLRRFGQNINPNQIEFEATLNGRFVDIFFDNGSTRIFYEFKSVRSLPPESFSTQFLKDLENATGLSEIKWIFDGKKISGNNGAFSVADRKVLLDELNTVTIDQDIIDKIMNIPNQTQANFISFLDSNFNQIFEIK